MILVMGLSQAVFATVLSTVGTQVLPTLPGRLRNLMSRNDAIGSNNESGGLPALTVPTLFGKLTGFPRQVADA